MLPCNSGGHAAFQDTFVSQFLKFYPDPFVLPKSTWDYIVQFWYLDLSKTDSIMQECYSVFGPEPRLSSSMASKLLPLLERWHLKPDNPFSLVFRLYRQQFPNLFIRNGLIDPEHLALAGDGTPVRTAAHQRKKRICIRTISPSMTMASLSVSWAYVCIKMDMKPPNTGQNTDAQKRIANAAASVNIPVHRQNTAEGLLWNAPTPRCLGNAIDQGISRIIIRISRLIMIS